MSSVVIAGNTSGSVTLSAPDVAGTTTLTLPSTSGTVVTTNTLPAGSVLQVVQTVKTDTFSTTTAASWVDITGMSVTITPSSSSNKILVMFNCEISNNNTIIYSKLVRNSTDIVVGDAAGSRPRVTVGSNYNSAEATIDIQHQSFTYLDSPATTSSVTYKLQLFSAVTSTSYVNRSDRDGNASNYDPRPASSITVMEIKG